MDNDFMLYVSDWEESRRIKKTNEAASRYGLCLSDQEIGELLNRRKEYLSQQQRVEFASGILEKLILAFCDSDFLYQDNYAETIDRLQAIFYLYKNESLDELTDEELIHIMRTAFDGECAGSLEYLESTYLEQFARRIRTGTRRFMGRYEEDDE